MPENSPTLKNVVDMSVKLATPLLLLKADLRRTLRESGGSLLAMFLIGSFGTLLGSFISYFVFGRYFQLYGLDEGWKLATALTAKNIGGGLNYMGVANALHLSSKSLSLGLTVDNFAGLLYFPFISYLATFVNPQSTNAVSDDVTNSNLTNSGCNTTFITNPGSKFSQSQVNYHTTSSVIMESMATTATTYPVEPLVHSIALSCAITAVSDYLGPIFNVPAISMSTIITVIIATSFPLSLKSIVPASDLIGQILLMLFFASVGNLSGSIYKVIMTPSVLPVFGFNILLYITHMFVIYFGGKLRKAPLHEILIGSNANIGNAATASALAVAKGWSSQVVPALLVGCLGNSIGTILSLWLGTNLLRDMFN